MSEPIIDTSKMSEAKRAAFELTESSREGHWEYPTFAGALFMGELPLELVHPYPELPSDIDERGRRFLAELETFLREKVDPDRIDREGEIPEDVIDGLRALGAFGIKIPREYGGLGMTQQTYTRAMVLIGSYCGSLSALVSAHQSIGVPQPLLLFGTEEQKKKFLPRVAAGEISAFALTERGVGSDPARMETRAEPTEDGKHFILNGEKIWCTNGTRAGLLVVMAKTPPKVVDGRTRDQVTAFIVDTSTPGVEVVHRSRFMGLRALFNGVLRFTNVKVPRENIVAAEGKGLRVALTTLNTGRITLPATCIGLGKRSLEMAKRWANEREQWGAPIGKHAAIADKIARIASTTFAVEAMTYLTSSLVDRKKTDIRVEAAMAKMYGTEAAWDIVDETMQILGGRGYETADSLRARGERPVYIERAMRDARINRIFEGSTEIMHLFIAREAMDPHLKIAGEAMNGRLPWSRRLRSALKAALFYAHWYPKTFPALDGLDRGHGRGARAPRSLRGPHQQEARAEDVPRHGQARPEARAGADAPRPLRRRRNRALRPGGFRHQGASSFEGRQEPTGRALARRALLRELPPANRGSVPRRLEEQRPYGLPPGAVDPRGFVRFPSRGNRAEGARGASRGSGCS